MKANRLLHLFQMLSILALAFALRHIGADWGQGHLPHPDERFLCMVVEGLAPPSGIREYFDTAASPLNPVSADNSRYVYGTLPLFLTHALARAQGAESLWEIARAGRFLSALWGTGTVLLLMLLARRLGPPGFASWIGILMALTALSIQQARFFTVDTAGVFFATLTVTLGIIAAREQRPWLLAPAGLAVGLAMACRLNLALLAIWLCAVALSLFWRRGQRMAVPALAVGGLLALTAFRMAQPYAFEASGFFPRGLNPVWLEQLATEHAIVRGTLEVPYTLQWVDRLPWIFALQQMAAWGMGWALGLTALGGGIWLLITLRRDPGHWAALLALWPLLLIGYHGGIHLHTMRYFLPAYPALILCGGLAVRRMQPEQVRHFIAGFVTLLTLAHGIAVHNLHRQTHPWISASQWLMENLPEGGIVAFEHWDHPLPLRLEGGEDLHARIHTVALPVYDPESPEKIEEILRGIDAADFLVLSSTRAWKTIPRAPLRYPVTSHFYERLLEERLGLDLVARFRIRPRFGTWELDTLRAEEAFRVYDHPLVLIFAKNNIWHIDAIRDYLLEQADLSQVPHIPFAEIGRWNDGRLTPAELEARNAPAPHTERFPPDGIGNRAPAAVWILALLFTGVAAFPVAWRLFPSLPDRGFSLARPLGLLLLTYPAWLTASLGWLRFGQALHISAALLFSTGALIFAFDHDQILARIRRNPRILFRGEMLFWGVFAVFLLLRWLQPDLWHPWAGGEKPMGFAYLNAIARSRYFPAHNPWLSGAFINYYDYGFVLIAAMIRITGILPEVAYNLALPTIAAFTAVGVRALVHAFLPLLRVSPGRRDARIAVPLAVAMVLFLGNLGQIRWLLEGRPGHGREVYWNASRVLRTSTDVPITEFPFFSHLYGDLHPHLIALPLAMLTLLAAWQLLRRPHPLRVLLCGGLLGTLWVTNTWDLPVQLALFSAAVFFPLLRAPAGRRLLTAWSCTGWWIAGFLTARIAFLPDHFKSRSYPAAFRLWDGPRSPFLDLFLAHGLYLIPLAIALPILLRDPRLRRAPLRHRLFPAAILAGCLLLIPLLEWITLKGDVGRMNTVFKFYYQIWWLLSIPAALTLAALWRRALKTPGRRIPAVLAGIPLLLGALYPLTATPGKLRERYWDAPRGLNGIRYLETNHWHSPEGHDLPLADDLAAIRWLRENAGTLDTVLEAVRPQYEWGGRISWHTGLPAVLGWPWHMIQQRPVPGGEWEIHRRQQDIHNFYTTRDPETALRIAREYGVKYVIFGKLERITYGSAAQELLETHSAFHRMHDGPTAIYEIRHTRR